MSIAIQLMLMSGETYSLDIFDGYRIVHAKNELGGILKVNRDLVTISHRNEDGEFEVLDNMEYVQDGQQYYVFIREEEDPPEYYVRFDQSDDVDFENIVILDEDEKEVDHIENGSIIHVQLSEYGWDFVRNVLRENRDCVIYDSEDEYDDPNNDRYHRLSKREAFERFISYMNITRGTFEFDIEEEEEEDEEEDE